MSPSQVIDEAKTKFNGALEHYRDELKKLRTGRAHPSMLEGVMVEAYGSPMPIIQVGSISAPEATLLQITPFDPNNLQAIADAIRNNQSLGLNPMDDGHVVRIPVPPLTEERRREITKQVGIKQEDCMITLRNIRHEALDIIDQAKKDKDIGEDEAKRLTAQIEDAINKAKSEAESIAKSKEQELMTVQLLVWLKPFEKKLELKKTDIYKLTLVAAFVQPLMTVPQVVQLYKTQNSSGLSLLTWLGYAVVGLVFLAYGIAYKLKPIAITQVLWFSLQMSIVVGILLFR